VASAAFYGEIPPVHGDVQPYVTFGRDGAFTWIDFDGDVESGNYFINARQQTIELSDNRETEIYRYRLVEDVLLLKPHDPKPAKPSEQQPVAELTRTAEGSMRHKAIRSLQHSHILRSELEQSEQNLRLLIDAILKQRAASNNKWPKSIGHLVLDKVIDPEVLYAPWSELIMLERGEIKEDEKYAQVLSARSSYVYLYGEYWGQFRDVNEASPQLVLIEINLSKEARTVAMAFDDGTVRRLSNAEASQVLKEQTGYTLEEWKISLM